MEIKSTRGSTARFRKVIQKILVFSLTAAVTLSSLNLSGVNMKKAYAAETELINYIVEGGDKYGTYTKESKEYYVSTFASTDTITLKAKTRSSGQKVVWNGVTLYYGKSTVSITLSGKKDDTDNWTTIKTLKVTGKAENDSNPCASVSDSLTVNYSEFSSYKKIRFSAKIVHDKWDRTNGENTPNDPTEDIHPDSVAKAITTGSPSTEAPLPTITDGSLTNQYADINQVVTFRITAQNAVSYQWQTYKNNNWENIGGATSNNYLQVTADASKHKSWYRCIVNGETTSITSNQVQLFINNASFTQQPCQKPSPVDEKAYVTIKAEYKNAGTCKWQYAPAGTNNWTDIADSNTSQLTFRTTLAQNNNKYRAIITHGNGESGTVISNPVTLSVTELTPVFSVHPKTQTKIEGQSVYFTALATNANSYWWEVSTDKGNTWTKLENNPGHVEITDNGQALSLYMIEEAQNGYRYRCKAKNVNETAESSTAILTVAPKTLTGIQIEYPYDELDYGSNLDLNDAYVFLKYDNGDSKFGKNNDCLHFIDGTRSKTMTSLGEQTFDVEYILKIENEPEKKYNAAIKVTVKDLSGPVIESFDLDWENNSAGLTGSVSSNQLTNVKEDTVRLTVHATDNYKSSDDLVYKWQGNGVTGQTGKSIVLDGNNGCGDYTVTVCDMTDTELAGISNAVTREETREKHTTTQTYHVDIWDYTPPTVNAEVTPSVALEPFKTYRSIQVKATDDHGLAPAAYSYDEGLTWSAFNSHTVEANGTYPVWVVDCAENVTKKEVAVSGIDRDAPEITSVEDLKDASDTVIGASISGKDATSMLKFGYLKEDGDILWKEESYNKADFLYTAETEGGKEEERNGNGRTFYVMDAAGNTASCLFRSGGGATSNVNITHNPTSWVNAGTGVELTAQATGSYDNNQLTGYRWNTGDYGETIQVHQNGIYSVTLLYSNGNNVTKSANVSNIDSVKPSIELTEGKGEIKISAADNESGVCKITIQGNEYEEETIVGETDGLSDYEVTVPTLYANKSYRIRVTDMVGNTAEKDIRIFSEPPSVTDLKISISPDTWTKEDVKVQADAADSVKNIMGEKSYSWDGGKTWTDKAYYTAEKNGKYRYAVRDKFDNVYKSEEATVSKIDKEDPTVVLYRSKSVVSVVTADTGSGIKRVEISGPDGNKTLFNASKKEVKDNRSDYVVTKTGNYSVTVTDQVGNKATGTINVSSTGSDPLPSIDDSAITSSLTHSPTEYTRGNVTMTAVLNQDCLPMLASLPYSWDGGKTWVAQPYCIVDKNGTYTLKVKDLNGGIHTSAPHTIENIDRAAPVISVQQTKTGVTVKLKDELSGLKTLKYAVANGATKTFSYGKDIIGVTEHLKLNKDGIYLFTATDVAGNEVSKQIVIKGLESGAGGDNTVPDDSSKDKDKDKDSDKGKDSDKEKDTMPPAIEVIQEGGKIIITVTDDGSGIDHLSYSDESGTEKVLTTLNGSGEVTYRVKPDKPGKYTFYAYDMDGNSISKTIDYDKDGSVSGNGTGDDGGKNRKHTVLRKAGFILLMLLILFLLLLIAYILYKRFTEKEDEETAEEVMETADVEEMYLTDQDFDSPEENDSEEDDSDHSENIMF